jgi:methylenetetrahydrofolate dehydrogenase (NADP+) / methenyltetrahydrofolate cyclohydrolase
MSVAGGEARLLDGRAMAHEMFEETRQEILELTRLRGGLPEMRVVLVGEDAASGVYARRILRAAEAVGTCGGLTTLPASASLDDVRATLHDLSKDPAVAGIILQLPLPADLDLLAVVDALDPSKDLDGVHPLNAGFVSRGTGGFAPSCAEAAIEMLRRADIPLLGRPAVVVGRSNVVGRPVQLLLLREDATVTVCHRRTRDLVEEVRRAEIVIVAAGSPGLIRGDALRPGAVVIDCGINVLDDGTIAGDVDEASVRPVASVLTPVPGGVGPVTNAILMRHLARAARQQLASGGRLSPAPAVAS